MLVLVVWSWRGGREGGSDGPSPCVVFLISQRRVGSHPLVSISAVSVFQSWDGFCVPRLSAGDFGAFARNGSLIGNVEL